MAFKSGTTLRDITARCRAGEPGTQRLLKGKPGSPDKEECPSVVFGGFFFNGMNKNLKGRKPVKSYCTTSLNSNSQGWNCSEMTTFINLGSHKSIWFKSTVKIFT